MKFWPPSINLRLIKYLKTPLKKKSQPCFKNLRQWPIALKKYYLKFKEELKTRQN